MRLNRWKKEAHTLLLRLRATHDILSDMVESGRLRKCDIPDDYQAVIAVLAENLPVFSEVEKGGV